MISTLIALDYGLIIWELLFNQIYIQKNWEILFDKIYLLYVHLSKIVVWSNNKSCIIFKNGRCLFWNNAKHSFDTQHTSPCFPRGLFYLFHNIKEWHGKKAQHLFTLKNFLHAFILWNVKKYVLYHSFRSMARILKVKNSPLYLGGNSLVAQSDEKLHSNLGFPATSDLKRGLLIFTVHCGPCNHNEMPARPSPSSQRLSIAWCN